MSDRVRVLRVIEYEGDREAVEEQVSRSIHGERRFGRASDGTEVIIRAATIGLYPEVLALAPKKDPNDGVVTRCLKTDGSSHPACILRRDHLGRCRWDYCEKRKICLRLNGHAGECGLTPDEGTE